MVQQEDISEVIFSIMSRLDWLLRYVTVFFLILKREVDGLFFILNKVKK